MASPRVSRGRATQTLLAAWFRAHGWPNAASRPASLPGTDIMGLPGLAVEVKATEKADLTGALRQAAANATNGGELPLVVYRPRGYGGERIGEWLCVLRLRDAYLLLEEHSARFDAWFREDSL